MLSAILYVLRTGIQWNALPWELGACTTVYDYDVVYETARAHHCEPHIRPNLHNRAQAKPAEPAEQASSHLESTQQPRRWVVERLHSWLNRSRRLLIRWEKLDFTYQAFLHLACGLICFQHCIRLLSLPISE
jgi:transposase